MYNAVLKKCVKKKGLCLFSLKFLNVTKVLFGESQNCLCVLSVLEQPDGLQWMKLNSIQQQHFI